MRTYLTVKGDRVEEVAGEVVREQPLSVYVNGEKFLTLLCSPMMLEALVTGYLGSGTTIDAWDVDVDGRPLVLWAVWTARTPNGEVQDLLGIVDSIELEEH